MLQKTNLVKYRKTLELTFDYLCRVVESHKTKKENGSVGFVEVEVYSDIPCRVSYKTSNVTSDVGLLSSVDQVVKLFISPDVDIKPNSKLYIREKTSEVEKEYFRSSEPKVYGSHQEIELKLVKEHC